MSLEKSPALSLEGLLCVSISMRHFSNYRIYLTEKDGNLFLTKLNEGFKMIKNKGIEAVSAFSTRMGLTSKRGWNLYSPESEFNRMNAFKSGNWRLSMANSNYEVRLFANYFGTLF